MSWNIMKYFCIIFIIIVFRLGSYKLNLDFLVVLRLPLPRDQLRALTLGLGGGWMIFIFVFVMVHVHFVFLQFPLPILPSFSLHISHLFPVVSARKCL